MIESIKIYEGRTALCQGANIVLSNHIFLPDGELKDYMRWLLDGSTAQDIKQTIYIYFRNRKPVAAAFNYQYLNEGVPNFQVFVKVRYRRNGIGSKLYQFALGHKKTERFIVQPWDNRSRAFFYSVFHKEKKIPLKLPLTMA